MVLGVTVLAGATFASYNIVNLHFRDIGHDSSIHDVTYENSQALTDEEEFDTNILKLKQEIDKLLNQ